MHTHTCVHALPYLYLCVDTLLYVCTPTVLCVHTCRIRFQVGNEYMGVDDHAVVLFLGLKDLRQKSVGELCDAAMLSQGGTLTTHNLDSRFTPSVLLNYTPHTQFFTLPAVDAHARKDTETQVETETETEESGEGDRVRRRAKLGIWAKMLDDNLEYNCAGRMCVRQFQGGVSVAKAGIMKLVLEVAKPDGLTM